jgi:hypothetical protein
MQQFVVPQFIDVEDKIIGFVTVRQFIICIIGGMVIFLEYKLSDFALFIILAVLTAAIFGTVAFLRINSMPFHYFFINVIETLKKPSLRLWQRTEKTFQPLKEVKILPVVTSKKPLSSSHLADLSLIVDTGGQYQGQTAANQDVFFNSQNNND